MQVRCCPVGFPPENCYLLLCGGGAAALVDPGTSYSTLLREVADTGCRLEWILLTHGHYDHIGAVQAIREATGARLAAPQAERVILEDARNNLTALWTDTAYTVEGADRYLAEGDTLAIGETVLQVLHTPGHTPGSVCYLCGRDLLAGDTLFYDSVGRVDLPGGDGEQMRASLRRLATLPADTAVYPGHGPQTTIGRELAENPYMNGLYTL